jgi:hypothetical protein
MPCPRCGLPHSATLTCHNAKVLARQAEYQPTLVSLGKVVFVSAYSADDPEPVTKNTVTVTEKKLGRPKKSNALSAAEKQKAYRERQRKASK